MNQKIEQISDIDIQLFLSGALPLGKKLAFKWLLIISSDLKIRCQQIQSDNQNYLNNEFLRLEDKLKLSGSDSGVTTGSSLPSNLFSSFGLRQVGLACALLVLVFTGVVYFLPNKEINSPLYAAKGSALGIHVYVKGKNTNRVNDYLAKIVEGDTLQVIPVSGDPQYLFMFGWSPKIGLSKLFPQNEAVMGKVDRDNLPPGLVVDLEPDLKLICVSSSRQRKETEILKLLNGFENKLSQNINESLLKKDIYIQTYTIESNDYEK